MQVGKSVGKSKAITFDRGGKAFVEDAIEHCTREDYSMESSRTIHNARSPWGHLEEASDEICNWFKSGMGPYLSILL